MLRGACEFSFNVSVFNRILIRLFLFLTIFEVTSFTLRPQKVLLSLNRIRSSRVRRGKKLRRKTCFHLAAREEFVSIVWKCYFWLNLVSGVIASFPLLFTAADGQASSAARLSHFFANSILAIGAKDENTCSIVRFVVSFRGDKF